MKNDSKWKFPLLKPEKLVVSKLNLNENMMHIINEVNGEIEPMAKQDKESAEEVKPNYTRWLLGTYTDPKTQELMLGFVPFDPVTKMTGEFQSERAAGNLEVLLERYMVKQASLGILEQGNFTQERKTEIY